MELQRIESLLHMMKRCFILFLGLIASIAVCGKTVLFVTTDGLPIAGVHCVGYSGNNDSIDSWVSNAKGAIDFQNPAVTHILASHNGFNDKLFFYKDLKVEANTITLLPALELKEVVVTSSDAEEFADHTTYKISRKNMARYSNVLQSLNEIPNTTVLSNGALFFQGEQNVKILINGVEASRQEIQTLAKEDIAKIDVYQTPPTRFLSQGVSAVFDIRLKSDIHGGNAAVEITQAFKPLKGDNSAALYYNYKRSRFTMLYNNENSHYRKFRQSEELDYDFDGVHFSKIKKGLDSKEHYDNNSLNLSYQINKPKNFLYHVRGGIDFNRDRGTSYQDVTSGIRHFFATNMLNTKYTKYRIGNYFEKKIGDDAGTFLANINYQHFTTGYNSEYDEQIHDAAAVNNSRSDYKTHLDAVFSELQYQLPYREEIGLFSFCAYGNYKHSKYINTSTPFNQTTNVLGGMAQWLTWKGPFRFYLILGANWYHAASSNLSKAHNLCVPSPKVNVRWKASENVQFTLDYSYSGDMPSIAQLSETNQWLDTKLVYHGNSTLKPYKTHSVDLRFLWNFNYVQLSVKNYFISSPGKICDMFTATDNYMLQTLVNLSEYHELGSQMDLSIMPLGNSKLVFWNRIIVADVRGKNKEYKWDGYRFQWMSNLALNLEKWTVELNYQYPGKIVEGQLERPRAQCWSATVLYRPNTNLSLGLEWFMPFGKGFKESEYTVNEAPVHANTVADIRDRSNMVSFKLSYNLSFGRNRNRARPQYDNGDNDSGILQK